MASQRVFDFRGSQPFASDPQHIVAAAAEVVEAVCIHHVAVAVTNHSPSMLRRVSSRWFQYTDAMEPPLTWRFPTSPGPTALPSSSRSRVRYPGTTCPVLPGRTAPKRLERKMWQISVDPVPSRTSTPNSSRNRRYTSGERISADEMQARRLSTP